MTPIVNYRTLTQDAAEAIVQAAKQAGAKLDSPFYKGHKVKMHIHVIGRECTLMAATQAFGAWPGSDDIATRKAKTAFYFKLPTRTIGELSRPELAAKGPLYAIEVSNGALISFPGGLPIFENGELVGAIGVSGDVVDADEQIAQAGVDAFKSLKNATVELPTITQSTAAFIGETAAMKATEIDSAVYKAKVKMHVHVIGCTPRRPRTPGPAAMTSPRKKRAHRDSSNCRPAPSANYRASIKISKVRCLGSNYRTKA